MTAAIAISARGVARWRAGHPWIYRSDVDDVPVPAGVVRVVDRRGRSVGRALWSPASKIRLRMLSAEDVEIDGAWWTAAVRAAAARRSALGIDATAYRVVHGEADGLPSLVVDRYGDYVVAQILSAGLESTRTQVLAAIGEALSPHGILLRNDVAVRRHEGLTLEVVDAVGEVPDTVEVREATVRYGAALRTGQKTGAFLDQRENRVRMGALAHGRALDVFAYQGLFALHLAQRAKSVTAIESSASALAGASANAARNGNPAIEWIEANAFDALRELASRGERFDTIVLDPPAFAKQKTALPRAIAAYKEINLRAAQLLAPGGLLLSCSCSFHLGRARFLQMVASAAADSQRRLALEGLMGQSRDHPEIVTIPETGYLKGALLRAVD